jgi:hypothetical protein
MLHERSRALASDATVVGAESGLGVGKCERGKRGSVRSRDTSKLVLYDSTVLHCLHFVFDVFGPWYDLLCATQYVSEKYECIRCVCLEVGRWRSVRWALSYVTRFWLLLTVDVFAPPNHAASMWISRRTMRYLQVLEKQRLVPQQNLASPSLPIRSGLGWLLFHGVQRVGLVYMPRRRDAPPFDLLLPPHCSPLSLLNTVVHV